MKQRPFGKATRRIYSILASFITLAIILSAYLTWRIELSERESLSQNEGSARRLVRIAALEGAASEVDLPANDVFADHDVAGERAKLEVAKRKFRKQIVITRFDVRRDPKAVMEVDQVERAIDPVLQGSEEVFRLFAAGQVVRAAAVMTRTNRAYAMVRKEIEDVRVRLRELQLEDFRTQRQQARILQIANGGGLAVMALLVIGLFAYGRRLDREVLTSGEREQYVDTLQKREEELRQAIAERDARGEELEQKQVLLTQAQQMAEMGTWELDLRTDRLWWSDELYRLIGLDPRTVPASRDLFLEKIVEADRERAKNTPDQALSERTSYSHEYRVVRSDGSERILHGVGRVDVDDDGKPVRMLGVVQDITERKWAEEQLLRQEAQLAEAQRIARSGSWELEVKTGHVTWSDQLHEMLGYGSGEVSPSFKAYMSLLKNKERRRVYGLLEKAMRGSDDRFEFEHSLTRKDGVAISVLVRGVIHRDAGHKPIRVLGVSQDITERKKAEADLRLSEERFKMAARATNDVIWDWNLLTGRLTRSRNENQPGEASFAQPFSDDLAATMRAAGVHPDDVNRVSTNLRETLQGSASFWNCEYRLLDPTGNFREVLDRASILRDNTGKAIRVIGAMADISERRAVDRMKDEFISTVSHELRTPLTSIRGALGLLSSGRLGKLEEKGQRLLEIASTNTDRLVRLINDILDIERIESGKVRLEKVNCDAADLASQAADVVRGLADRENITITVEAEPVPVFADPDRMVQTMTNLLGNAVKFSPKGSTIRLAAKREGQNVVITVADQGRGIPQDKLTTIFERFQQVDASDSRDKGGSGLGLAICRSIVRQHGGDIRVESELGKGSTFIVTIPAGTVAHTPAEAIATERIVYVCDDDEASRDVLHFFLTERGYEVRETASGQELLHAVAERKPDAILLDLFMPDMNGWETLARLKSDPETSNIPVIVVSVLSPDDTGATELDLSGWVQKPLDGETLAGAVDRAFGGPRKPRLMLVEDDNDLAATIIASFERHGIETIHARSGKEAIELARKVEPDLLILDLVLPDLDGYAIVDWLKDHEVWRGLPMVVYSATEPSPSQRDRLRLGHTEFMTKSRVAPEEFEKRIVTLLDSLIDRKGGPAPHATQETALDR